MGLAKLLARRGAVGGTARWAANGYHFFRQRHPDSAEFPDSVIFRLMIVHRYEPHPDKDAEQFLLSIVDTLTGLQGLVVAVLTVEAGFTDNDLPVQRMFMDVIAEELAKKHIPSNVIGR